MKLHFNFTSVYIFCLLDVHSAFYVLLFLSSHVINVSNIKLYFWFCSCVCSFDSGSETCLMLPETEASVNLLIVLTSFGYIYSHAIFTSLVISIVQNLSCQISFQVFKMYLDTYISVQVELVVDHYTIHRFCQVLRGCP